VGVLGLEAGILLVVAVVVRCELFLNALSVRRDVEESVFMRGGFWSCYARELMSSVHGVEQEGVK
jgi:hypothetical protein